MITGKLNAEKSPIQDVIMIMLLFIAMACLPMEKFFTEFLRVNNAQYLSYYVIRFLFSAIFILFIILYGFNSQFYSKFSLKSLICITPVIIIAINNFPFYSLISGDVAFVENIGFNFEYLIAVFSIAFVEELVFRGIILPLVAIKCSNKFERGYSIVVIVISSIIFGLTHIVNIFAGGNIGLVFLQIGYSFLLGCALSFVMIKTKNIFIPTIIHFIYNLGGFLSNFSLLVGTVFTVGQIILTACISVIMGIIIIKMIFSLTKDEVKNALTYKYCKNNF